MGKDRWYHQDLDLSWGKEGVSTGRREQGAEVLFRAQYPQPADVGVFSVHVVCEDDDLKNVGMYSFAGAGG